MIKKKVDVLLVVLILVPKKIIKRKIEGIEMTVKKEKIVKAQIKINIHLEIININRVKVRETEVEVEFKLFLPI